MKKIIKIILCALLHCGISVGSQDILNSANRLIQSHKERMRNTRLTPHEIRNLKERVTNSPEWACEFIKQQNNELISAKKLILAQARTIRDQAKEIDELGLATKRVFLLTGTAFVVGVIVETIRNWTTR